MRVKLLILFLLFSAISGTTQGPPDNAKIKMEVDLVRIDALVLNGEKPVSDLKKENFSVYEDGIEQEMLYFSDSTPLSVVVAVDLSGSLKNFPKKIEAAMAKTLSVLSPDDQIALVGFDDKLKVSSNFTADRKEAGYILGTLTNTEGRTDLVLAINSGIEKLNGVSPSRRRVLVLISDNADSNPISSTVMKEVEEAILRGGISFHNIKVGSVLSSEFRPPKDSGEALIRSLSKKSGGQIIDGNRKNILGALTIMVGRLKNVYSFYYKPGNPENLGPRKVRVELKNNPKKMLLFKKYKVVARKEYYLRKTGQN